jgi:N-acetylmuramoyl-L-alanine amidase
VVVLDPGHGGKDAGATGCNGLLEKDVVLRVSRLVRQGLTERNFKVIMTRDQDEFVELEQRAAAANQAKADLFVAIHADSATNHLASGHTVYVSRSPSSSSLAAANAVNRQLGGGGSSRGVRQADYRVLVHCNVPAMLVEVGYLSNPVEAGQLGTGEHCAAVADALAAGILEALRR